MSAPLRPSLNPATFPTPAAARREWPIRLLGIVLVLAVGGAAWYWMNPAKQSGTVYALLYVAPPAGEAADPQQARREEIFRQTQAGLLRTHTVLERALRSLAEQDLTLIRDQSQPLAWLERELRVESPGKSRTIRVALSGDRPRERAQLVNAVVRAYLAEFVDVEQHEQHDRLVRCERLVASSTEQIGRQLGELQTVSKNLEASQQPPRPGFTSTLERQPTPQDLEALTAQISRARAQLEQARKKDAAAEADKASDQAVEDHLAGDPLALQLRGQIARLKRTLAAYEANSRGAASPSELVRMSLKGYQSDLAVAEHKLNHRRDEIRAALLRQAQVAAPRGTESSVKQLEEQLARWTEEEKALRQRLEAQPNEADATLRRSAVDLGMLLKELERKLDTAKRFTQECDLVRKEIQAAPRVQLVQEAAWPEP